MSNNRKTATRMALLSTLSLAALAACNDDNGGGVYMPPAPPPPPPMGAAAFGAGFATAFNANANAAPVDPKTGDIIAVDPTKDPNAVP